MRTDRQQWIRCSYNIFVCLFFFFSLEIVYVQVFDDLYIVAMTTVIFIPADKLYIQDSVGNKFFLNKFSYVVHGSIANADSELDFI